jgi:hypothetical protein
MAKAQDPEGSLDSYQLEKSLPTLTEKLRELQSELSDEERAVFSSIVSSAALHLQSMKAIESTAEIRYAKPISAAATTAVRNHLLRLPETLGLAERE